MTGSPFAITRITKSGLRLLFFGFTFQTVKLYPPLKVSMPQVLLKFDLFANKGVKLF